MSNINILLLHKVLGDITEAQQAELDSWIARNDTNRQYYETIMNDTDAAKHLRQYDLIDNDLAWEKFREVHFLKDAAKSTKVVSLMRYVAAAAVLVLLAFGAWMYMDKPDPVIAKFTPAEQKLIAQSAMNGRNGATIVSSTGKTLALTPQIQQMLSEGQPLPKEFFDNPEEQATVMTNKGQEFWMTLEDGTRVHLNYNSSLRYPEHFTSDARTIYLDGEAYFDVAHDSKRPFYVQTPNGTVREYGTSFNVNTKGVGGCTEVVLVSGSISVTPNGGAERMMKAGQLARFNASSGDVTLEKADVSLYVSWNTGEYQFDGCPMEKLMKVLSCWYNMSITFKDPSAKDIEFTGSIDRYEDIKTTLSAISYVTGHNVTMTESTIVIH